MSWQYYNKWSPEIEAAFRLRILEAPTELRPFHLRQQALALVEHQFIPKYVPALALLEALLQDYPGFARDDVWTHVLRGACLAALDRLEEALDAYDTAVRLERQTESTGLMSAAIQRASFIVLADIGHRKEEARQWVEAKIQGGGGDDALQHYRVLALAALLANGGPCAAKHAKAALELFSVAVRRVTPSSFELLPSRVLLHLWTLTQH